MTSLQAARVAADVRRELGEEVKLEDGRYGEFKVFVDGEQVVDAGPLAFLGVLPSVREVRSAVAARVGERDSAGG